MATFHDCERAHAVDQLRQGRLKNLLARVERKFSRIDDVES